MTEYKYIILAKCMYEIEESFESIVMDFDDFNTVKKILPEYDMNIFAIWKIKLK